MAEGINTVVIISDTIKLIIAQLKLAKIPIIVCIDSYSLYEYLVKLKTIKEKRFIIDIISLR